MSVFALCTVHMGRTLSELFRWWEARMLPHHAAERSSGLEQRAGVVAAFFFSSSFCLQDTIASFNILYLAPAKRGNSQGE